MMKYQFVMLLFSLLFTLPINAKKKVIILSAKNTTWWDENKRSIENPVPTIFYDENTFLIHSAILLENVKITIKDKHGNNVDSILITVFPNDINMFTLNINNGNYLIELEYTEYCYYGYFEINQ